MVKRYSRLRKTQERRNIRKAFIYIVVTLTIGVLFVAFGIPSVARFADFIVNLKQSSQPIEKNDTTPPIVPSVDPLPEYTNQVKLDIAGSAEPGSTIVIDFNKEDIEVVTDKNGEFNSSVELWDGVNTIRVKSMDNSGNESDSTELVRVTYDNESPSLEINSPSQGDEFYGSNQRQIVIEGVTEENSQVYINDRFTVVDSEGNFTYVTTLENGENTFNIKAVDRAGNTTEKQLKVNYIE
jgi:hypothetical protein